MRYSSISQKDLLRLINKQKSFLQAEWNLRIPELHKNFFKSWGGQFNLRGIDVILQMYQVKEGAPYVIPGAGSIGVIAGASHLDCNCFACPGPQIAMLLFQVCVPDDALPELRAAIAKQFEERNVPGRDPYGIACDVAPDWLEPVPLMVH